MYTLKQRPELTVYLSPVVVRSLLGCRMLGSGITRLMKSTKAIGGFITPVTMSARVIGSSVNALGNSANRLTMSVQARDSSIKSAKAITVTRPTRSGHNAGHRYFVSISKGVRCLITI